MGDLTRADLLAGVAPAGGNDQAVVYVRRWLDNWLRRTAKTWSWPVLKKRANNISVPAGTANFSIGNGVSTTVNTQGTASTHYIHRLVGNILFYRTSTFNPRGRVIVRPLTAGDPDIDEDTSDPTTRRGLPDTAKLRQEANGKLTFFLDPVPDRDLIMACDVLWIPPRIGTGSANDTQTPWYPNDRTIEQAVKCAILELDAGGQVSQALDEAMVVLGAMVVDDRDFDGEQAGDNQVMELDPAVFGGGRGVGTKMWPR